MLYCICVSGEKGSFEFSIVVVCDNLYWQIWNFLILTQDCNFADEILRITDNNVGFMMFSLQDSFNVNFHITWTSTWEYWIIIFLLI